MSELDNVNIYIIVNFCACIFIGIMDLDISFVLKKILTIKRYVII